MSRRLNQKREAILAPKRMASAVGILQDWGFDPVVSFDPGLPCIKFEHKGSTITFWPYSGWHSGKSIKDGRGLIPLLKKLERGSE